jgi:hypothetical protein
MSFMFEVYYKPPANPTKEALLSERIIPLGGRLDYREDTDVAGRTGVCLTYEFDSLESATRTANLLRQLGEHVEGPVDYGS